MPPASFSLAPFCFQVHPTLLAAACDGHCVIIPAAHNYRTYLRSHSHTLTNLHAHPFACVSRALFFPQSYCSAVPRRSKRRCFKVELGYGKVPENTVSVDACILCLFSRSIFFVFEAFQQNNECMPPRQDSNCELIYGKDQRYCCVHSLRAAFLPLTLP